MPYRTFIAPRQIFYGAGALEALTELPGQRALIVTDPGVRRLGLVDRVEKILHTKEAETAVFDEVEPDPPKETVWSLFALAQGFQPDLFVGLGGGSSIDAGKAAWALYEHPDLTERPFAEVRREVRSRELRNKAKYVAIPTTSGTGSEVTNTAVVTDHNVQPPFKAPLVSPHLVPDVAIADPELAASMPPAVTANTGFDALVHAIECYVLTPPSDMIDSLALWAAKTIWEWLPKAVADGKDMVARDKMHLASLQAGMAFSNGRLGLVHTTAHVIGGAFGTPHGRANAFMLCPVFAFLYPSHRARLSSLAAALGIAGDDDQARVTNLLATLDELKEQIGIPLAMREAGIEESRFQAELETITGGYMEQFGRAAANLPPEARRAAGFPRAAEEVKELFLHAWKGTRPELG